MPENFDTSAAFTDMLEINVDANLFRQGLEQLRVAYNEFVASLGSGVAASDIINIGSFAALKTNLDALVVNLNSVKKEFSETFADVTGGIVESLSQISDAVGKKTGKKSMVSGLVGDPAEAEDAKKRILEIDGVMTKVSNEEFLRMEKIARQHAGVIDKEVVDEERLATAQRDRLERIGRLHAQVLDKQATDAERAAAKEQLAQERAATQRQLQLEKIGRLHAQVLDKEAADAEKEAAKETAATDRAATQRQLQLEKIGRLHAQVLDQQAAETERATTKEIAATEKLARMQEQAYFAMQKDFAAREEAQTKSDAKNANPFGKWAGSILDTTVTLLEFYAIMKAIQVLGDIITAPFKLMAEFVKDGFTYLSKMQQSAADLQGVLASSVIFTTAGIAQNFKEAGEAADYVVKRLQDIAIKVNLPVQNLTSSFKAVADSGGSAFVKDLDQMVKLSELFAIAVKATGKDFQVQRALISEIPKLLDGTVTSQSLILNTLGLTKDAWEKIRQSGLQHKDLVAQLEPLLAPFLTVSEQADLRLAAITEKLTLFRDRLAAIMVMPVFQLIIGWLQKISDWLDDHGQALEAMFKSAGEAIVEFLASVKLVADSIFKLFGIKPSANGFLKWLNDGIIKLREFIAGMTFALVGLEALANPSFSKSFAQRKADFQKAADDFKATLTKIVDDRKAFDAAISGGDPGNPEEGNKTILGGKSPSAQPDKSGLDQLKRDFKEEVEAIKLQYKALEDERKRALDAGEINMKAYTATVVMLANDEKAAFDSALKSFDAKANKSGAPGKSVKAATDNANQTIVKDKGAVDAQIRALDDSLVKYEAKLRQDALEHSRKLSLEQLQEEKRVAQATGATKTDIAKLDISIQEKSFQDQKAILDQEAEAAGLNEQKLENISFRRRQLYQQNNTAIALNNKALDKAVLDDLIESDKKQSAIAHEKFNQHALQIQAYQQTNLSVKQLKASNLELANAAFKLADADLDLVAREILVATAHGADKKVVDELKASYEKLRTERDKAAQTVDKDKKDADGDQARLDLLHKIFGDGVKSLSDVFHDGFANGTAGLLNAFTFFKNAITGLISAFKQGNQQGGVLGGLGAVATQVGGQLSEVFPVAGAIVGGIGQVMSLVGGLFKAQAKRIADDIKKSFDKTMQDLQNGSINLSQAIQQVAQERADAVARLSGKKGGKDELAQLLPTLDNQLASLRQQQKQTLDTFEQQLKSLQLQSDTLGKFLDSWTSINKQVKDYLDAGGSVAKANQFLSLSLQNLQKQTQDSLDQGQQTAIQDAIQLNDLLTQRINLIKTIAKNEFDAATADSLERNQAGAIVRGTALSNLKADDAKQLDDINSQIDLQNKKVDKERQVFDIATDIKALHQQDADLQLKALDAQISQWKDMKLLVDNIVNNNGVYSLSAFLLALFGLTPPSGGSSGIGGLGGNLGDLNELRQRLHGGGGGSFGAIQGQAFGSGGLINGGVGPAVQIGTVTVNATGDPNAIAGQVVDSLTNEIQRRVQQGRGAFFRF